MQRWFFLEDSANESTREAFKNRKPESVNEEHASSLIIIPPKPWLFRILALELNPQEVICVTGNVPELGSWNPEKCIPLQREGSSDIWSKEIMIPDQQEIHYRYCACVIAEPFNHAMVRNWECFIRPRKILSDAPCPTYRDQEEYGYHEGIKKIDRGWLTAETVIHFKFFYSSLTLWRPKYMNRPVFIKITPVLLHRHNGDAWHKGGGIASPLKEDESLSADTHDTMETAKFCFTEVASLNSDDCCFYPQGQFGREYKQGDALVFQCAMLSMANIAFLIDLYIYSKSAVDGDPPYHAGFSYILPSTLHASEGRLAIPVTSTKHRPLGQIDLEYLVIKPMPNHNCDLSVSYSRHWNKTISGLDVGHRGSGSSFKLETKNCAEVRENTIASLKTAASHGADFVEFDVQLSKDLVPIIYHDFHICIAMKKKKELNDMDMLELPIKDLTLEQLQLLKVYHLTEGKSKHPRFFDDDLEEHQPFPTLQQVLDVIDPHVGFNIEIKWNMQLDDGSYELNHPFEINMYLDTILDVVMKNGSHRRIIFSCFNPDICSMIRLKQNKYPVLFLTQGQTSRYPPYHDPRCLNIKAAVQFAVMQELLGINVHTEDLLNDSSQVKLAIDANLVIFCWGDENADSATIKHLKSLGLHGIIYDKIDQYSGKETKESIFMVEARESQNQLILLAAAQSESAPAGLAQTPKRAHERPLDVERARQGLTGVVSTATSLESLESHVSDYEQRLAGNGSLSPHAAAAAEVAAVALATSPSGPRGNPSIKHNDSKASHELSLENSIRMNMNLTPSDDSMITNTGSLVGTAFRRNSNESTGSKTRSGLAINNLPLKRQGSRSSQGKSNKVRQSSFGDDSDMKLP